MTITNNILKTILPVGILGVGVWAIIKNWDKINPFDFKNPLDSIKNPFISSSGGGDSYDSSTHTANTYSYGDATYTRNEDGSAVYTGSDGERMTFGGTDINPKPVIQPPIDTTGKKIIATTSQANPIYESVVRASTQPKLNTKVSVPDYRNTSGCVSQPSRNTSGMTAMDKSIAKRMTASGKSESQIITYLGIK